MMYRPISIEVNAPTTLETAITVSDANVVRVVNTASSSPYLLTVVTEAGVTVGTMTLLGNELALISKPKTYKLFASNSAVKLASITYPST